MGPLGRAKFHTNRCHRVGTRPLKWQKFPHFGFLLNSRPTGTNPLTDFYRCYGLLYAQQPCISVLYLI